MVLGYALRKHISNALQKRSAAVRTALDRYNAAARLMTPPRTTLKWDDVVEYAFLSDFDLLRDSRQDIRVHPWSTPTGRFTLDTSFKIRGAAIELKRLNLELIRVATHIRDENLFLRTRADELHSSNPLMAHQINVYHMVRGCFDGYHIHMIRKTVSLPGYTRTTSIGEAVEPLYTPTVTSAPVVTSAAVITINQLPPNDPENSKEEQEREDDQEAEERAQSVNADVEVVLTVSMY